MISIYSMKNTNMSKLSVSAPIPVHSISESINPNLTSIMCSFPTGSNGSIMGKVTSSEYVNNRKSTHNQAEKMRIQKISEKIKELQDILERHGKLKKRDKKSIVNDTLTLLTSLLELKETLEKELLNAANSIIFPQSSHICDFSSVFKKNAISMVILNQFNAIIDCNDKFRELSGYEDEMKIVFRRFITDSIETHQFISCLTEVISQSNITSSFTATCKFPNNSICHCYISLSSFQHYTQSRYISLCLLPLL